MHFANQLKDCLLLFYLKAENKFMFSAFESLVYLIKKGNRSKFFNAIPVPLATALRGSSAT